MAIGIRQCLSTPHLRLVLIQIRRVLFDCPQSTGHYYLQLEGEHRIPAYSLRTKLTDRNRTLSQNHAPSL